MKFGPKTTIRRPAGWSIIQPPGRRGAQGQAGEQYLRKFWVSRRGGFYRLAILALAAWGTYSIVGTSHGLVQLQALAQQETNLRARKAEILEESRQVQNQLLEGPAVGMERGLRERFRESRKNEIVYDLKRTQMPADSTQLNLSAGPSGTAGSYGTDSTGDSYDSRSDGNGTEGR
jgi:hypothetical protein